MDILHFTLPWPITVNKMYGFNANRKFLTNKARVYKRDGIYLLKEQYQLDPSLTIPIIEPVIVFYSFFPPDKRIRDKDNVKKIVNDCLESAGILKNDNLIERAIFDSFPGGETDEGYVAIDIALKEQVDPIEFIYECSTWNL